MRVSSRVGLLLAALYAAAGALSMALWYYTGTAGAGIFEERWGMRGALLAAPWYFVPFLLPDGHRVAYLAWAIGVAINAALVYRTVRAFERWRARRRARAV